MCPTYEYIKTQILVLSSSSRPRGAPGPERRPHWLPAPVHYDRGQEQQQQQRGHPSRAPRTSVCRVALLPRVLEPGGPEEGLRPRARGEEGEQAQGAALQLSSLQSG